MTLSTARVRMLLGEIALYLIISTESVMEISDSICTDFYQTTQLVTTVNNAVGSLTLMTYMEIEFDVTFGAVGATLDHWTNVFRIGNQDDLRFPGLYMSPESEYISVHKTTNENLWYPVGERNPSVTLTSSSNNMVGSHHLYIAITPTQYIFIWDDILYRYSGDFNRSKYIGTAQNIYFSDNTFTSADAVFDNICIRSSSVGLSIDGTSAVNPSTTDSATTALQITLEREEEEQIGSPIEGQRWERQVDSPNNMGKMIAEIALVGFVFLVCGMGTFFLRRKWIRQQMVPDGSMKVDSSTHRESQRAVMDSPHVGGISTSGITRIMSESGIDVVTQRSASPGMIDQDDTRGQYPILSQIAAQ